MGLFTVEDHPVMLRCMKEIEEQCKLNVDEYTKMKKPLTPIQSFYAGKSIFLTGATGFLGICIVEKILRDCSDIKKLYLLARPNKSDSLQERMKKYFSNVIFDRVRKINENFEEKVVVVSGNLSEKGLGLSAEERQLLIDNIDIIIHNGAVVKFNVPISVTLKTNVLGTKEMLDLALACKHVKAFAYVSTAYSHNYKKHIKEEFYEAAADLKAVHNIIAADEAAKYGLSKETANMFIDKWVNVYTFAKSISEDLVRQYGEKANFSCTVYRPSMIIAAYKEPMIGWLGNKNGPMALLMGSVLGAFHVAFSDNEPFDTIPVDYTVNSLLASTYDAAKQWEKERRPRVYNFASSTANPVTIEKYYNFAYSMIGTVGCKLTVWHMSTVMTMNKWLFYLMHFFTHFIPACFADIALLLMKKKPRALSVFVAVTKNLHWLMLFMSFGWRIQVTEMRKVFDNISEVDRKLFDFDIWSLNWEDYTSRLILGPRIWYLNEPLDNIEKTKRRYVLFRNLHFTLKAIFYFIFGYYLIRLFSIII